jgi:adenylate cyclase
VKRMTYMSAFARPLDRSEIDQIGIDSSRRNAADGISGVLLTLGDVFFQIIEGDEWAIDDLYRRVLGDDRHTDIICLRTEHGIAERLFPDWSMNVLDLDHLDGDVVGPMKLLLGRMGEAQHIIERYTQPAVSRILRQGLNPLDVPLHKADRLVMFTDMVAFSAISDRLPIDDVSQLVSAYFEICCTGIARRGGEVTKLLGDGVMAYFDPDLTDSAIQSCADILLGLKTARDDVPPHSPLRLLYSGFGLALGPVLEGSMGSSVKMDYTIIGEPVNTAARLEALTRTLDTPVLMTEAVKRAAKQQWSITDVGAFDIGLGSTTQVYSLDTGDDTTALRATAERALHVVARGGTG